MFEKRKLKAQVVRLTYRVKELEERLCPCGQHDWVIVGREPSFVCGSVEILHKIKCRRCGKESTTWEI